MDYIQLKCVIIASGSDLVREMLIHELAEQGFESFAETIDGLNAYIVARDFDESLLKAITFQNDLSLGEIRYSWEKIKDKNWNEEWEKNFQPVLIGEKCYIRSPFHEHKPEIPYEIIIEPKMSFGTGHHETTSLMIEQMLSLDFKNREVLDMGCGTGVLGIMASMLGAHHITGIDIDDWAYQNAIENCSVNSIKNITVFMGDVSLLNEKKFDIILANINRNILLNDIASYSKSLVPGGTLLLSGIYAFDLKIIKNEAETNGLVYQCKLERNNWIAPLFLKQLQ